MHPRRVPKTKTLHLEPFDEHTQLSRCFPFPAHHIKQKQQEIPLITAHQTYLSQVFTSRNFTPKQTLPRASRTETPYFLNPVLDTCHIHAQRNSYHSDLESRVDSCSSGQECVKGNNCEQTTTISAPLARSSAVEGFESWGPAIVIPYCFQRV